MQTHAGCLIALMSLFIDTREKFHPEMEVGAKHG
jgi:hypothetical protein